MALISTRTYLDDRMENVILLCTLVYTVCTVVFPKFGHPVPTPSFTKYSFVTIVNGLSVSKLFQLSNDDLLIS